MKLLDRARLDGRLSQQRLQHRLYVLLKHICTVKVSVHTREPMV